MKSLLPLAGVALLTLVASGEAASGAETDAQDIVYLRGNRPLLLRFHVEIDDRGHRAVFHDYMKQLFAYLDRDGDGFLSKEEAERAPRANTLQQIIRGQGFFQFGQPNTTVPFQDLKPENDKVDLEKLSAYYRKNGLGAFQLQGNTAANAQAEALTDLLFKALDRDKDGKLSKEELAAAADALRKFDVDDDETVTVAELVPNGNPFVAQPQPTPAASSAFVAIEADEPALFVARLLEVFDKDKNKTLSREESGLDKEAFAKLDSDGNGELDAGELRSFHTLAPDGMFQVRLGGKNPGVEVSNAGDGANPLGLLAKKAGDGLALTLSNAVLDLRRTDVPNNPNGFGNRQFFMQQFRTAAGAKGFVEKKDVMAVQNRFIAGVFPLADRDADDQLTEKELTAFLDIYEKASRCSAVALATDQGRGLFDALDANKDGRLGFHELRSAWDRLKEWDRDTKGGIVRGDVPGQLSLAFAQGVPNQVGRPVNGFNPNPQPNPRVAARGPVWFRKMDRNGDGVVSQREWLGSAEDFKRFDVNGDGAVDADEAEKAATEMRK